MSLKLDKVWDPRDNLQRIRRKPLENYFRSHYPGDFEPGMPASLMRMLLRKRGVSNLPLPKVGLGDSSSRVEQTERPEANEGRAIDAMELLKEEWANRPQYTPDMDISFLRKECKAKGIKLARTDKRADMVRKLNVHTS